jgi:cytosine/adenosine deaminase-related metal-dependent hydrolase
MPDASRAEGNSSFGGEIVAFHELIAPTPERVPSALETARRHLAAAGSRAAWRAGLSPHAPYTVCAPLLTAAAELAAANSVPLAMHLAESPEEIEWLATGGGPIAALLASQGTPPAAAARSFGSVLEVVESLRPASRVLLVHGNYLREPELKRIAAEPQRLAVVYCPRTNTYFHHAPHPLERLLALGATVALGTDGRGSNPDLSLLAEMRHLRQKHSSIPAAKVLELGTLSGARALGCQEHTGSLVAGKRADLCVVPLPRDRHAESGKRPEDPAELILQCQSPVSATIAAGRAIYAAPGRLLQRSTA